MQVNLEELNEDQLSKFTKILIFAYSAEFSAILEYLITNKAEADQIEFTNSLEQLSELIKVHGKVLVIAIVKSWRERNALIALTGGSEDCQITFFESDDYKEQYLGVSLAEFEKYAEMGMRDHVISYQENKDYSDLKPQIKALAYYLPQFHETPENNEWWGRGFTEWANTKKSKPRFKGHYQPREPHNDIGYYDLTDVLTLKKQAALAREHGIFGFCVYYYWFSGRRLLHEPLDLLFENKDIDINFCFLWANENWTRTWDDNEEQIIMRQEYREDDPERFIDELQKYFSDERYIRHNGKPLLLIYRLSVIPHARAVIERWRKRAREIDIGELEIIGIEWLDNVEGSGVMDLLDARAFFGFYNRFHEQTQLVVEDKFGAWDYTEAAMSAAEKIKSGVFDDYPTYHALALNWDNAPRHKGWFTTFDLNFSLRAFYDWARVIVEDSEKNGQEFMFINAWNEWAESSYLEPDKKYGYALINTLSKALCGLPYEDDADVMYVERIIKATEMLSKSIEILSPAKAAPFYRYDLSLKLALAYYYQEDFKSAGKYLAQAKELLRKDDRNYECLVGIIRYWEHIFAEALPFSTRLALMNSMQKRQFEIMLYYSSLLMSKLPDLYMDAVLCIALGEMIFCSRKMLGRAAEQSPNSVRRDEEKNLYYFDIMGKKLFYAGNDLADIQNNYRIVNVVEQAPHSPHRYFTDEFSVRKGDVFCDIGAAEGNISLQAADICAEIYIFEFDRKWNPALLATFAPYEDKTTIVNKLVSDVTAGDFIRLDDYFGDKAVDFLKLDVEGYEMRVLRGAERILKSNPQIRLCVCTYHKPNDGREIKCFLEERGFKTQFSEGLMFYPLTCDDYWRGSHPDYPYFRQGLIRAWRDKQ